MDVTPLSFDLFRAHTLLQASSMEEVSSSTTTILNLPDDCWKLILSKLDHTLHGHETHRDSLSLTCKHLLSITNRLPFSLSISLPLIQSSLLPSLLKRFSSSIESIDFFSFHGDLDSALCQIFQTPHLDLLSLKYLYLNYQMTVPLRALQLLGSIPNGLKVLKLSNVASLLDEHLPMIGSFLPFVEELDVSFDDSGPLTDLGIHGLAKSFKFLKKINVSGNKLVTDKSLVVLADCCLYLNEIEILGCDKVTQHGVGYLLRKSRNLGWISLNTSLELGLDPKCSCFSIADSIGFSRSLSTLEFYAMDIEDDLLYALAKADLPLKKFTVFYCEKITLRGVSAILRAYPNLEQLGLEGVLNVTDEALENLVCYLRTLIAINISSLDELTFSSLYTIVKNCPHLEEIKMESTILGEEMEKEGTDFGGDYSGECLVQGQNIKCLKMSSNRRMTDKILKKIGVLCPNIVDLDLSFCRKITSKGVGDIMKSCPKIKHLEILRWREPVLFDTDLEGALLNLELLQLIGGKFGDQCLSMIAKACPNLLYVNLTSCESITSNSVKELVSSCTKLREINLWNCAKLDYEILTWIVSTRPSVRKIVGPRNFTPTQSEKEMFLNHNCFVQWL